MLAWAVSISQFSEMGVMRRVTDFSASNRRGSRGSSGPERRVGSAYRPLGEASGSSDLMAVSQRPPVVVAVVLSKRNHVANGLSFVATVEFWPWF